MARHGSLRRRAVGLAIVATLTVTAAACGDDDSDGLSDVESAVDDAAEELQEQAGEPDADTDPDIDAPAATGTVEVSGAIEDTRAEADDADRFRAGGGPGCGASGSTERAGAGGGRRAGWRGAAGWTPRNTIRDRPGPVDH